ncbi:MAG: hypothetical protein BAJATHORv1_20269 [Candidatus Thorarchaeota archaeon]|nr:MAG: hypothetical protein BAJATHORv1_20269 [Candidatus Thorarchaeota archaeon]
MKEISCPKCDGTEIRQDKYLKKIDHYKEEQPVYSIPCMCKSCGHEWEHNYVE